MAQTKNEPLNGARAIALPGRSREQLSLCDLRAQLIADRFALAPPDRRSRLTARFRGGADMSDPRITVCGNIVFIAGNVDVPRRQSFAWPDNARAYAERLASERGWKLDVRS